MFNHHALSRTTLATAVAAVALSLPMTALAQLEEVIVTAQKRSESLQDVPISIDAFSGDELQELGVQSAHEILRLIPNAGTVPQGGAKQNFFIRGVGTADFHLNVVGAVGVFLDDVSLNSPFAVSFAAYDMERAEVLRGPQNTLFGRNTTGGAVNFISTKPR
ncbi:MAG: TonB-dependent receptor plug domain-containing protein, partial [Luminiphilus sp.]